MNLDNFKPHHLCATRADLAGNGELGRYVLLPGSDGRAEELSAYFDDVKVLESPRRHNLYLGTMTVEGQSIDVAAVASGMGCPSLDIIVNELVALGVRRILRVGTAGALHPRVKVGELVVGTGGVRDEHTSSMYAPLEFPALAGLPWILAAQEVLRSNSPGTRVHFGVVHSKDSLFAREFHWGPRAQENRDYMALLSRSGALASEMESSHLFVLGQTWTAELTRKEDLPENHVHTGAVLAIIGDEESFAPAEIAAMTVESAIQFSLATLSRLALSEVQG